MTNHHKKNTISAPVQKDARPGTRRCAAPMPRRAQPGPPRSPAPDPTIRTPRSGAPRTGRGVRRPGADTVVHRGPGRRRPGPATAADPAGGAHRGRRPHTDIGLTEPRAARTYPHADSCPSGVHRPAGATAGQESPPVRTHPGRRDRRRGARARTGGRSRPMRCPFPGSVGTSTARAPLRDPGHGTSTPRAGSRAPSNWGRHLAAAWRTRSWAPLRAERPAERIGVRRADVTCYYSY